MSTNVGRLRVRVLCVLFVLVLGAPVFSSMWNSENSIEHFLMVVGSTNGPITIMQPSSWYMLIDEPGYYRLDEDIINCTAECCIYITASDVVLDGAGHLVDSGGSASYGVYVYNATNVVIKNLRLSDWSEYGVYASFSNNTQIDSNTIWNCTYGIYLTDSDNCEISNNIIENSSWCGIHINAAWYPEVNNNTVKGSYYIGISVEFSRWCEIANNTIISNENGLYIHYCTGAKIHSNIILDNYGEGLHLDNSDECSIYNNTIERNSNVGLWVDDSANNEISWNVIRQNDKGIWLYFSERNRLYCNTIENNTFCGLELYNSQNDEIFANNIIDNFEQYEISESSSTLYSSEPIMYSYRGQIYTNHTGNYWSDYNGTDTNGDGIGETPYGPDKYPLVGIVGEEIKILIDRTPPVIEIISPSNNSILNTTRVTIVWRGSDDLSGIDHYEIYVDDVLVNDSIPAGQNNYTLTLGEGKHTIEIKAIDKAGNEAICRVVITIRTSTTTGTTKPAEEEERGIPPYAIVVVIVLAMAITATVLLKRTKS